MNERAIFETAFDISDPAERAAFLDRSCGENADMRRRLDELLAGRPLRTRKVLMELQRF